MTILKMTRSNFKKVWFLAVGIFMLISLYMYQQGSDSQTDVMRQTSKKNQLSRVLRVGNKLSSDLVKLDNLTINETNVTKLDILRFLGLENSNLDVKISSKVNKQSGKVKLYQRDFSMSGVLPYADVLDQIDAIHNTKKVIITEVKLNQKKKISGDNIEFEVKGVMYGLEKR